MMTTIKHGDSGKQVVAAKLLTGYVVVKEKVKDSEAFLTLHGTFDASFTAHVCAWQKNNGLTPDGIIGPMTWKKIAEKAPTCSTSKNRKTGYALALQFLIDSSITADAIFGERTKGAVVAFQSAKGLKVDGVCGPKTWGALIVGASEGQTTPTHAEAVASGTFVQPTDFKQGAKPWGPKMYSNHNDPKQTMANSGCGPTSAADIVHFCRDNSIDPYDLAMMAVEWGDRSYNSGTNWSFFTHLMTAFNFKKMVATKSVETLKACLDAGGYAVASMGPGYWTSGGHFITPWKYDANYIYCNDPASSTRKKQNWTDFQKQRKQFFCFFPNPEEIAPTTPEPASGDTTNAGDDAAATPEKRGDKIVDISKYQPTVDYDKLIEDTALIILRAGYRGTGGGIHEDQKFELHASELIKRGVRFGVYFYSIATNEAKAQEEARMFYQYAKDYNPLFWAMDAEKDTITNGAIREFVGEMRRLGAKKVGCYVANHLYTKYDYASIADSLDFTWIPRYSTTRPSYKCDLWQFTSTGSVNGISGNVDMNKITGDGHDLAWFTEDNGSAARDAEPTGSNYVVITGGTVNVREGAGVSSPVIGVAKAGAKIPFRGITVDIDGSDWYSVSYNGKDGWVSSKYSRVE